MSGSLITLPARLTVRATRAVLITTRDAAQQALGIVDLVAQVVETPPANDGRSPAERRFEQSFDDLTGTLADDVAVSPAFEVPTEDALDAFPEAVDISADPEFGVPDHLSEDAELVQEIADAGAQDGAGATIRVDAPWAGYEKLRAADVVARLRGADTAELGAIELYESTHRKRRTVLDGIVRELKRRP